MRTVVYRVRYFSFLASSAIRMLLTNPVHFLLKGVEWLPASYPMRGRFIRRLSRASSKNVRFPHLAGLLSEDICRPELEEGVNRLHEQPRTDALVLLNNSLPHVASGYAERSQNEFSALMEEGVENRIFTQLGFPLTVGKFPKKPNISNESLTYNFIIPWLCLAGSKRKLKQVEKFLDYEIRKHKPKVLHTTTPFSNGLAISRVAAQHGLPWIYEARGEPEKTWLSMHDQSLLTEIQWLAVRQYHDSAREQESRVARAADIVIVLSKISADEWIQRGVDPSRIVVIPNAISADDAELIRDFHHECSTPDQRIAYRQNLREQLLPQIEVDSNILVVGTITSVVAYEGIDTMIKALAETVNKNSSIYLVIVGNGPEIPNLIEEARELGVEDHVLFVGRKPRSEILEWYKIFDIFLLTRHDVEVARTVTPMKSLVAQALGTSIIASDLPALREVTGGKASYIPAGDYQALSRMLEKASEMPEKGLFSDEHVMNESIEFAINRTWDNNARSIKDIYRRLSSR